MKHTTPDVFLTREILGCVRGERPTPEAFIARFGEPCFHLLRKAGVIVAEGERLRLSRRHLSPDEQRFVWRIRVIPLDQDRVDVVRWGPGGPPVFDESS